MLKKALDKLYIFNYIKHIILIPNHHKNLQDKKIDKKISRNKNTQIYRYINLPKHLSNSQNYNLNIQLDSDKINIALGKINIHGIIYLHKCLLCMKVGIDLVKEKSHLDRCNLLNHLIQTKISKINKFDLNHKYCKIKDILHVPIVFNT